MKIQAHDLERLRDFVAKNALSMVDHANHKPENRGQKPKVGGHQASSMSSVDLLSALYLNVLEPGDRLAVKPHASPVLYSLMYLFQLIQEDDMRSLREYGGLQPYPTELKNPLFVDYTTSSEALGVACTIYDAYGAKLQERAFEKPSKSITYWAHAGDGELTEGQIDESLYDAGRWRLDNLVWIIDLNRQSLDRVMDEMGHLDRWVESKFQSQGFLVTHARWGKRAEALFQKEGGEALKTWLEALPDAFFHLLTAMTEAQLKAVLSGDESSEDKATSQLIKLFQRYAPLPEGMPFEKLAKETEGLSRQALHLGGHDLDLLSTRFLEAKALAKKAGRPVCVVVHTIKGYETSAQAHPENHGILLSEEEVARWGVQDYPEKNLPEGEPFPRPEEALEALLDERASYLYPRDEHHYADAPLRVRQHLEELPSPKRKVSSTGEAFQSLNLSMLRTEIAPYLQFSAPDVGQTTHLGPVIKRTGVFSPRDWPDTLAFLREEGSLAFDWRPSDKGQFHSLAIAEGNAMLFAYAFGRRKKKIEEKTPLLPVVTVYDKFFERGFNQLDYAVYSNARFIAVGTPSGTGLSRETATHQSVQTLRMLMDLPGILTYEPAFSKDVHAIYRHALSQLWEKDGEAVYLRLTTQPLMQPEEWPEDHEQRAILGAYWLVGEDERKGEKGQVLFIGSGRKLQEIRQAAALLEKEGIGSKILNVTSYEKLWRDWDAFQESPNAFSDPEKSYYLHELFQDEELNAPLIIVGDHSPSVVEWLPSALMRMRGYRFLGPRKLSEAGDLASIDAHHKMGVQDIIRVAKEELDWREKAGLL